MFSCFNATRKKICHPNNAEMANHELFVNSDADLKYFYDYFNFK